MTTLNEELIAAQIALYRRQARWETPKALAMILLAVAALSAASHLVDFFTPSRPQQVIATVHIDGARP